MNDINFPEPEAINELFDDLCQARETQIDYNTLSFMQWHVKLPMNDTMSSISTILHSALKQYSLGHD